MFAFREIILFLILHRTPLDFQYKLFYLDSSSPFASCKLVFVFVVSILCFPFCDIVPMLHRLMYDSRLHLYIKFYIYSLPLRSQDIFVDFPSDKGHLLKCKDVEEFLSLKRDYCSDLCFIHFLSKRRSNIFWTGSLLLNKKL